MTTFRLYLDGKLSDVTDQGEIDTLAANAQNEGRAYVIEVYEPPASYARLGNDHRLLQQSADRPIGPDLKRLLSRKRP